MSRARVLVAVRVAAGGRPDLCRLHRGDRRLVGHVRQFLGGALSLLHRPLVIPLGAAATEALKYVDADPASGGGEPGAVHLLGFPHPSGANGHRVRQFSERRQELSAAVAKWAASAATS